jgi:hypothetical protein
MPRSSDCWIRLSDGAASDSGCQNRDQERYSGVEQSCRCPLRPSGAWESVACVPGVRLSGAFSPAIDPLANAVPVAS